MANKGIAQGACTDDILRHAEALGPSAIINAAFDVALGLEEIFRGSDVVIEPSLIPA